MCYFGGYRHPYAVHIFKPDKPSREEAVSIARLLLKLLFPEFSDLSEGWPRVELNYVGYEELPVDINDFYYVVTKLGGDGDLRVVEHFSSVPKEVADKILEYRLSNITLDYDEMYETKVYNCISAMTDFRGELFNTYRGYHFRAPLPRKVSLEELLELRYKYKDDILRWRIDKAYAEAGLGFLTNFLFNEKHWLERDMREGEKWLSHREVKVEKPEFTIKKQVSWLPDKTPPFTLRHEKGIIEVNGNTVIFKGFFDRSDVEKALTVVAEEVRRKLEAEGKRRSLKEHVANVMSRKSKRASWLIRMCEVWENGDVITIMVPEHLNQYVGLLIGSKGSNVKFLESELKKRVRIVSASGTGASGHRTAV